ncbi:MAG: protein kinase, partial [Planctomycetota bacterium]|nr:protein kinase [Planctomycetota bacterium]
MTERGDRDGADRGGRRPPSSDDPSGKAAEAGPATPGGGGFSFGRDGFVGHYRIIRELGHGGQGLVYLAEDTRLSRQVALKIMSPEFSRSKGTLARFHREAATASRLDHPGICSIYEAGETDGIHFIAMRYVEGYTLAEMISEARQVEKAEGRTLAAGTGEATAETPVTPSGVDEGETVTTPSPSVDDATDTAVAPSSGRGAAPADRGASPTRMARLSFETTMPTSRDDIFRVLRIVEHAARALHVAHEAGLIHRDIKPGNIMVDANGDPVLLDFGLAREESEDGGLTISGDLLGTPAYMSPEQIAAHRIALDRRTDNYSLGVTLYECLTLRRPYDAPTRDAIYQKILTADLPDPRRINPHIDRDLRVVLETAMERDRERRYKTALDFAEDLRRIRGFEPIQARPAGPVLRVRRWVQRNPVLATATLGLFLILSTALGITLGLLDEVREESVAKDEALARVKEESEAKEAALTAERAALVRVKKESDAKDAALVAERAALAQVKEESDAKDAALVAERAALAQVKEESDAKEAALTAERAALARLKEESEAKEEALRRTTSLYLTGRAQSVLPVNPKQALLLGLEGAERLPGDLTNDVLLRGLRSDREIHTLDGDGDPVARVAFSPGGRLAATSSPGSRVRVWNVDSGECELLLEPPEYGNVKSLAFSPDSRRIVVATGNGRAYLWNPFSGRLVATLEGHLAGVTVTSASFSSDSSRVVTSSHDGTARVWSAEDGSAVGEPLRGHETGVGTASFSPDGTRVVTGSDGYVHTIELNPSTGQRTSHSMRSKPGATSARIFDVASGRELVKIGDVEGSVRVARFSPDGRFVLTESFRGVQLHDAADGKLLLGSKERYWNPGGSAMFSPDGKYVVGASVSGAVTLWSVDPPEEVRQFSGIDRSSPLMFGPGGKLLVGRTDSDNDILGLWDVESGNRLLTFLGHEENITSLAFHLDGRRLLSGSGDGTARIWDATLGREFGELLEPSERRDANRVYFSGDGSRMVIVRRGGTGEVRATSGGEKISTIANPRTSRSFLGGLLQKQAIAVAFFTPDGERIVGDVGDGTIYFWDRDGKRFVAVRGVPRFIRRVAFSEDGKRLAILGRGKSLAVVRLADGEKLRSWSEVSESVRPLFSPGGDHVLMGVGSALHLRRVDDGEDVWRLAFRELGGTPGFVRFAPGGATLLVAGASYATIFETGSGRKLVDVDDARAVRFAEFDPSGRRLMVVAGTRVGVWDAETGKRLFLLAPGETLVAGALSADGERVTTISRAGVCRVWDSSDGKLLFAVQGHQGPVRSAAFHPGGKKLLTVSADRTCRIWDEDGKELERFEAHTSGVALATWSPDGERAVSVGKDGFAHVWSAATAETIGTLRKASFGGPAGFSSAPFGFGKCLLSRDGRRLLETTYYFGTGTRIWNTDTGQLLLKLPRALSSSQDEHAISPDGRLVHVVNRDRQPFRSGPVLDTYSPPGLAAVRRASVPPGPAVLDVESGTVVCAFAGLGFTPRDARFSLDGRRLVVASGSNVAIWDTTQDRQLARLPAQRAIRQPARLPAQRSIRQLKS